MIIIKQIKARKGQQNDHELGENYSFSRQQIIHCLNWDPHAQRAVRPVKYVEIHYKRS